MASTYKRSFGNFCSHTHDPTLDIRGKEMHGIMMAVQGNSPNEQGRGRLLKVGFFLWARSALEFWDEFMTCLHMQYSNTTLLSHA